MRFQSTHPVGVGRRSPLAGRSADRFQSTHPVGGGTSLINGHFAEVTISIHPPRGGWDYATHRSNLHHENFNPPTPWGVGLSMDLYQMVIKLISIHPPRGGWDPVADDVSSAVQRFQSTHPVGGGTPLRRGRAGRVCISIHPPRGGWDPFSPPVRLMVTHFNPPTPWGVGLAQIRDGGDGEVFQSTHPVGGGTVGDNQVEFIRGISIHPPRGGWDPSMAALLRCPVNFNPPTPWGVGPRKTGDSAPPQNFNPPTPWGVGPLQWCKRPIF